MAPPKGGHPSPETRAKLSAAKLGNQNALGNKGNLGKKASSETRARMSAAQMGNTKSLGKKASEETRAKMSVAAMGNTNCLGRKYSPETCLRITTAKRGPDYRASGRYCAMVYENSWGQIPIEECGRAYAIHHRDGNRQNDEPDNLIALTDAEHTTLEHALRRGDFDLAVEIDSVGMSRRC